MTLSYASLAEIRSELNTDKTIDDSKVIDYGRQASARIDRLFFSDVRYFFPVIKTRAVQVLPETVNSVDGTLSVPFNLLELTSLVTGDTTITDVEVYPPYTSPTRKLRLTTVDSSCLTTWYSYQPCGSSKPLLAVLNGVWGFHRDYANAWLDAATTTAPFITTTTQTTFTVASIANLSPGQLIKIDSEYMEVVSVATLTVTVKRGVNGSTAAAHLIAATVYVWQVEEPIKRAVYRQAAFMYARRGAYESSQTNDLGMIQFPADLLAEVYGVVQGYAYQ